MIKKQWVWTPAKQKKPIVPESMKIEVQKKADAFIESFLKPTFIKPPPKDTEWNYLIDILSKWRRNYLYFIGTYCSPSPKALSKTFEDPFTRMEYLPDGTFALAYMRHTRQWWEIFRDLSLEECLKQIKEMPHFQPTS